MGNSGKSNGKFGQKQSWEIWGKAMGNSGKNNNFARKKIIMPPLSEFFHCFCPNFPIAFAPISHWLCPNFPLLFPEIWAKAIGNSGKSNGQIWAKAMRKHGKRWDIFRAKIMEVWVILRIDILFSKFTS